MSSSNIDWPAISWLDSQLADWTQPPATRASNETDPITYDDFLALGQSKASSVRVTLPCDLAYADRLNVRTKNTSEARKVAAHEAVSIDPLAEQGSIVLGGELNADARDVPLLILRPETLSALEDKADELGVQSLYLQVDGDDRVCLTSPGTRKTARMAHRFWLVSFALLCLGLWAGSAAFELRETRYLSALTTLEMELRQDVARRRAAEREVSALQALAQDGADRQTAPARLAQLKTASDATPSGTRWMAVSVNANVMEITGLGPSAAEAREALAAAFPEARVAFSRSIASEGEGLQSFVISVEPVQ